jgi:hypothetical protein
VTDDELITIATEFRSGILGSRKSRGMCFVIAAPLQALLSYYGFETELVEHDLDDPMWRNHVWIRLPDGRALDPTADQFADLQLPPVYLGEPHPKIHKPKAE